MSDRWTMIGGFVALAGLILYQSNATRADMRDLRSQVSDLGERVTRIETRLESFEIRFERIESILDSFETRFERIESILDSFETRFERIETRLDGIDLRFGFALPRQPELPLNPTPGD